MKEAKPDTYQKILRAASRCFSEKGFNATSVGDIARAASLSQGAMYVHFRNKADLIAAIVETEKDTALEKYTQPFSCGPIARICELIRSCINEVGYPADHKLWVEIIAEAARNPSVRETFISTDKIMRTGIKSLIEKGVEHGDLAEELDSEAATLAIFALIDGFISRKAINPDFNLERDIPGFDALIHHILMVK
ncbi:TetR family transcriptional regulator [Mangrovibacter sp. MFB070]|uniref:TetR/AcrR family transcriptional regulator n=1 Tax=Mangrovibacter sp. MFB070 TaxID=1224318 RepID=UPI0004D56348|nr:TetR/AcrR family transcriptional regulator [Mangrovibacter sp. MFB070]KEA53848.1 TetR family transcriptional regulator [Mangrovibacter sp. MFB070]